MQQRIKMIEAYFATKSVLLTQQNCRRDFGRSNVPNRRKIQRLMANFRETGSVADVIQRPQWSTSFKSLKSNKPGSFSILWRISFQNVSPPAFFLISLPPQDLNFVRKELNTIMEDPPNWCSRNNTFLWGMACWFSGAGLCGYLPHFLSSEIWPPHVELSFYQVRCSCLNLSCIVVV